MARKYLDIRVKLNQVNTVELDVFEPIKLKFYWDGTTSNANTIRFSSASNGIV